jgi:hypothetical protein
MQHTPLHLVYQMRDALCIIATGIYLARHPLTTNPDCYLNKVAEATDRLEDLTREFLSEVGLDTGD